MLMDSFNLIDSAYEKEREFKNRLLENLLKIKKATEKVETIKENKNNLFLTEPTLISTT